MYFSLPGGMLLGLSHNSLTKGNGTRENTNLTIAGLPSLHTGYSVVSPRKEHLDDKMITMS